MALFQNRQEAANELARALSYLKDEKPIVLGLANGGVPIAEIIAAHLEAPFDTLLIERLHAPRSPEHVVGAVDEHGRISMIQSTARWHHVTSRELVEPARDVFREVQRRRGRIRAILPEIDVRDRTVIVVSQGLASGAKMLGAITSVRDRGARKVIAAAPAGATKATWQLHEVADMVVIPHRPSTFTNVSDFYSEFSDVTDELVEAIISKWVKTRPLQQEGVQTIVVKMTNDLGQAVFCEVDLPPGCTRDSGPYPAVIFAHGYESDGRNPRTAPISRRIAKRGLIGVRIDFTGHGRSEGELSDATDQRMFNDMIRAFNNVAPLNEVDDTRVGLVGSGTGGLLCIELAQRLPAVAAMVIRSPLTGKELRLLQNVAAATLIIHAGQEEAIDSSAAPPQGSRHQMLEVPDATRLFNDPISLEMMVGASVDWLVDHLSKIPQHDEPADEGGESSEEAAPREQPGVEA
jgi:putative phosphoribosyl transferase